MRNPNFRYSGTRGRQGGASIGSVVFPWPSVAPDSSYVAANGNELLTADAPEFYQRAKLWGVPYQNVNADTVNLGWYTSIKSPVGIFLMQNVGTAVYLKATATGDPVSLGTPASAAQWSVGYANGFWCYETTAAGTMRYSEAPWTTWNNLVLAAGRATSIVYVGGNYIIARSTSVAPLYGATIATCTNAGTGTSIAQAWHRLFVVGTIVYAQAGAAGVWAKSTDYGVTWTVASSITNAPAVSGGGYPGGATCDPIYCAALGKFYGLTSAGVLVSAVDPTSAWTIVLDLSSIAYSGGTLTGRLCELEGGHGVFIKAANGTAMVNAHGNAGIMTVSTGLYGSPWMLHSLPGGVVHSGAAGRCQILKPPTEAVQLPTITAAGEQGFIKVR